MRLIDADALLDELKTTEEGSIAADMCCAECDLHLQCIADLQYIVDFYEWLFREPPLWKFWRWRKWRNERPIWKEAEQS